MKREIAPILWLLGATLVLCAVAYPLALLGVGEALFRDQAEGSLVTDGPTRRPTEFGGHTASREAPGEPPGWWREFWRNRVQ